MSRNSGRQNDKKPPARVQRHTKQFWAWKKYETLMRVKPVESRHPTNNSRSNQLHTVRRGGGVRGRGRGRDRHSNDEWQYCCPTAALHKHTVTFLHAHTKHRALKRWLAAACEMASKTNMAMQQSKCTIRTHCCRAQQTNKSQQRFPANKKQKNKPHTHATQCRSTPAKQLTSAAL